MIHILLTAVGGSLLAVGMMFIIALGLGGLGGHGALGLYLSAAIGGAVSGLSAGRIQGSLERKFVLAVLFGSSVSSVFALIAYRREHIDIASVGSLVLSLVLACAAPSAASVTMSKKGT